MSERARMTSMEGIMLSGAGEYIYTITIQNMQRHVLIRPTLNMVQRLTMFAQPIRAIYCSPVPSGLSFVAVHPLMALSIPSLSPVHGQTRIAMDGGPMEQEFDPGDWEQDIADFEKRYAEASGTTVAELHHYGRRGALCDCREDMCDGFQMLHDQVVRHASDPVLSSEHWCGSRLRESFEGWELSTEDEVLEYLRDS